MTVIGRIARVALIVMTLFLAVTALLGGLAIIAGVNVPSSAELSSSVFGGATIPGIALFAVVGGSALLAAILLLRRSRFALLFATTAAVIIMFFEFVEVMVIGAPPGVARTLQLLYFGLGTAMVVAAMVCWFVDLLPARQPR